MCHSFENPRRNRDIFAYSLPSTILLTGNRIIETNYGAQLQTIEPHEFALHAQPCENRGTVCPRGLVLLLRSSLQLMSVLAKDCFRGGKGRKTS